jgi:hypothetical protein
MERGREGGREIPDHRWRRSWGAASMGARGWATGVPPARWTPVLRTRRWHGVVVDGGTAARWSGDWGSAVGGQRRRQLKGEGRTEGDAGRRMLDQDGVRAASPRLTVRPTRSSTSSTASPSSTIRRARSGRGHREWWWRRWLPTMAAVQWGLRGWRRREGQRHRGRGAAEGGKVYHYMMDDGGAYG